MTAAQRTRPTALAAALLASAVVLAACSGGGDQPAPSTPTASGAAAEAVSAASLGIGHVHNVALDGDAVLIGTHEGLYRQEPGAAPVLVGEPFDVMGFTMDGQRWLASGHPAAGSQQPPDLGLLQSTDQGAAWEQVSLSGEADFHRLAASQGTVLGVNSGDGLLWRSADGGATWQTHGPGPFDVALDPEDPASALGTTPDGPTASSDGGATWAPVSGAPLLALLAWTDGPVVAVDPQGAVLNSQDGGATWTEVGEVGGQPTALAADTTRVAVLVEGTLWESTDGGATFSERITGLPGSH